MATSRIAESVGRVLGDRYRLTRPLGVGASAPRLSWPRTSPCDAGSPSRCSTRAWPATKRSSALSGRGPGRGGPAAPQHPHASTTGVTRAAFPYLVMELLEGGSLRSLLDRGRLLSPAQAAAIGADVARALDYAHGRGLVHRDIKPANLIFDDEGSGHRRRFRSGPGPRRGHLDRAGRGRCRHGPLRRTRGRSGERRSTAGPTSTPWPSCSSRRRRVLSLLRPTRPSQP